MNWMWIAALVWTAIALPLGLLTGIYLRRSDRYDAIQAADRHPSQEPPLAARTATVRPGRARRRQSGVVPSRTALRGIHRRMAPPPARDVRTEGPAGPTPAGQRGRSPLYRHR